MIRLLELLLGTIVIPAILLMLLWDWMRGKKMEYR